MSQDSAADAPAPGTEREELARLARALTHSARRAEWRGQRRTEKPGGSPLVARGAPSPGQTHAQTPKPPEKASPPSSTDTLAALEKLRTTVADCRTCHLHETRQQTVFMDGSAQARILFIGEAPGADEDTQGIPFVGAAGRLLTDIIEKGMGLKRSEIAIVNVLKCRPPGNRDPEPEEKAACTPYLDQQIELIDPEVLIPLGRHAAQHILQSSLSISSLRGRIHDLKGRKVIPTVHPAYLLRNPEKKGECWADIQIAMGVLGLPRT
ncbi:MAG: uracil-DNA glycosylase family 4 [Planctomycetota bacterium]|jgi:uracil-DNA glycosylase family 4